MECMVKLVPDQVFPRMDGQNLYPVLTDPVCSLDCPGLHPDIDLSIQFYLKVVKNASSNTIRLKLLLKSFLIIFTGTKSGTFFNAEF